ncbi:MAG: hypothetical protein QOE22_503 [Candidatus Parcubacteria bacterium]|nr:hypothetical protein [Candidatus Parcubacteria bacterium]
MITSEHDTHLPYFSGNVGKLATTHTLRNFALVLVDVFLPIFLLTKGLALYEVLLFEAFVFTLHATLNIPSYLLNARFGIKLMMSASFLFMFVAYGMLFFFDQLTQLYTLPVLLFFLALFNSIGEVGYWSGFHLDFALKSESGRAGSQLGTLEALSVSLKTIAPIIGAFFIVTFSFNASFLVVLSVLALSVVPLLLSDNIRLKKRLSIRKAVSFAHVKLSLVFMVEGFHNVVQALVWPLFLFVINFSLIAIGSLVAVATFLTSIISFLSGKFADKYGMNRVFRFGAVVNGSTFFMRPLFESVSGIFMIQSIGGLSSPLFKIPLMVTTYQKARNENIEILMTRDIYINLGRVIFLLTTVALVVLMGSVSGLIISLMIGGFTTVIIGFSARFFKEQL